MRKAAAAARQYSSDCFTLAFVQGLAQDRLSAPILARRKDQLAMKPNVFFIFDKLAAGLGDGPRQSGRDENRLALMEQAREIGLRDRGIDIGGEVAGRLADALLAAQDVDRKTLLRIRRSLTFPSV